MSKIASVFGNYASRLQVMIDNSLGKFAPTWFDKYFDWAPSQSTLNFTTVIGRQRIEAAASVIARGSTAPLRSRAALEKLTGSIPPIAEKFAMSEDDYRDFLNLQNMQLSDETKRKQLLDLLFDDVKKAGDAAMKRLDIMVLEGLSTGTITLTVTNNPDGVVLATPIDLLMPSSNKTNAAVDWATSASATPLKDIMDRVEYHSGRGVKFEKILMTRPTFMKFIKTTEVINSVAAFVRVNKGTYLPTLSAVNDFLQDQLLPPIELVEASIGIEKDGAISTIKPFKDENVVFVPAGKLGKIHNAIAIEELRPVEKVSYAKFNNALISKWQENEPFAEFTKVELNAFPGIDAIDSIAILSSNVAF